MNDYPQFNGVSRGAAGSSVAIGFVVGALVGAGVALLLAPGSGEDTRRRLVDAGGRLGNAARTRFDQARDTANDLKQDVQSALEAGREAFEQGQRSHDSRPTSRSHKG